MILPNTIYGALVGAAFAELVPNVRVVCRERHSWLQGPSVAGSSSAFLR